MARVPILNNCPIAKADAYIFSPTPLDAGVANTEAQPQYYTGTHTQETEFPGRGQSIWGINLEDANSPADYTENSTNFVGRSATSCVGLETTDMATYVGQIAAGYAAGTAPYTTDASQMWGIYAYFFAKFPSSTVGNVKAGLPLNFPPISSEKTFMADMAKYYENSGTSYGRVEPCGSVMQYSVLETDTPALHVATGSCLITTNRLEFGEVAGTNTYGYIPLKEGTADVGGTRLDIASQWAAVSPATNSRNTITPPDPKITDGVFSAWRSVIAGSINSETYNSAQPFDGTYIGAPYTEGPLGPVYSNPHATKSVSTAALDASQHAVCTMDAPLVIQLSPSGISLVKSASVTSYSKAGVTVTYYYKATNTSGLPLTAVAVTDPMAGLSKVVCPDSTLAPGASETCSATYTTTANDVTVGSINNTGTATGTPPNGPPMTATSSLTIPLKNGTTTTTLNNGTTTTTPKNGTTTTVPVTTPTLVTGPPGSTTMQTLTESIPVFVDGGSLRVQQFVANILPFDRSKCNQPSTCQPKTLTIIATVVGTDGYTECTSQGESGCGFYIVSRPNVSPTDTTATWQIDFLAPTVKSQGVYISFTAAGTYLDHVLTPQPDLVSHPVVKCPPRTKAGTVCTTTVYTPQQSIWEPVTKPYALQVPGKYGPRVVSGSVPLQ
jgi:hypothetical protein